MRLGPPLPVCRGRAWQEATARGSWLARGLRLASSQRAAGTGTSTRVTPCTTPSSAPILGPAQLSAGERERGEGYGSPLAPADPVVQLVQASIPVVSRSDPAGQRPRLVIPAHARSVAWCGAARPTQSAVRRYDKARHATVSELAIRSRMAATTVLAVRLCGCEPEGYVLHVRTRVREVLSP